MRARWAMGPLRVWEDGGEATVGGQPAPSPAAADPGKGKPAADTISLSKKDYEALLRERDELRTSERYWSETARGGKRPAAEPEPEPEPAEEDILADIPDIEGDIDPEAFTDALTAKGRKALEEHGFISKAQMRKILAKQEDRFMGRLETIVGQKITGAQQAMLKDAELLSTYPDLNNQNSPFFKRTKELYAELVADEPALKKGGAGLKIAAKMAKAEMGSQRGREADIERRIAAQQGDLTGAEGGDDEGLTPAQRQIIAKFNADGGPQVSEEAYKRRARAGVNMGGKYQPGSMDWR